MSSQKSRTRDARSQRGEKRQTTKQVDRGYIGLVIGQQGATVKRICRHVGAGCFIQHTENGLFRIEAWTSIALMQAQREIDLVIAQATGVGSKSQRKSKQQSKQQQQSKPKPSTTGGFDALLDSSDEETEETEETKQQQRRVKQGRLAARGNATSLARFIDPTGLAARKHTGWVERQLYHGNEVAEEARVHPRLARAQQQMASVGRGDVVQILTSEDFPSMGGGNGGGKSVTWAKGDLTKVRSEEAHVEKPQDGPLRIEDLATDGVKSLVAPGAPVKRPQLVRQFSGSVHKMQPLSLGETTGDAWGDSDDEDGDLLREAVETGTGGWDTAEWA